MSRVTTSATVCLVALSLAGCLTYAQRTEEVVDSLLAGRPDAAHDALLHNRASLQPRNALLHELNLGTMSHHAGEFERSNAEFEQAYITSEDTRVGLGSLALAQVTNPETLPYRGEDFELVLLHYYMALNYLSLGDLENALVEARRINIRLSAFNQEYGDYPNRYTVDAFATWVSGMIYEAAGEYNDAFIAYRNAYDTYVNQYVSLFGTEPPTQLEYDLIRSAAKSGLSDEKEYYERRFGMTYQPDPPGSAYIIALWHTGLGPVKTETSFNFFVVRNQGGGMAFVNSELGISVPIASVSSSEAAQLSDLRVVRVAFPRYEERVPRVTHATVATNGEEWPVELAEDVNAIAFTSLEDRAVREMASVLLRLAFKQIAEAAARRQNPDLGTVVGIANAITERADTRNWQTIPHSIYVTRIVVRPGDVKLQLATDDRRSDTANRLQEITIAPGETRFVYWHTLSTYPAGVYR